MLLEYHGAGRATFQSAPRFESALFLFCQQAGLILIRFHPLWHNIRIVLKSGYEKAMLRFHTKIYESIRKS